MARSVVLGGALLAAACQKKDSSAACGTSVAGAEASGAGTTSSAGANNAGAGGGALVAAGGGGTGGVSGSANLGAGGTGAAAATGGGAGVGGVGGAPPDSSACGALALADCATNASCQGLSGQRISGDPLCLSPYEVVACGTKVGCSPDATRATDLDGHDWVFPSTCLPAGWVNSSTSGTRFDACAAAPDAGAGN